MKQQDKTGKSGAGMNRTESSNTGITGHKVMYLAPAASGEALVIEKRSKFIAVVMPVESEESAKEEIARIREKHRDASHNCWCYIIRGGIERYSDDGEPQGTAGLPMLEVFRRGGIVDVCCVVTRYFGGTLLGAGGLVRAYSEAAKSALDNAGIAEYKLHECLEVVCTYNLQGKIKQELEIPGVIIDKIEYIENVIFRIIIPSGQFETINKRLADASAGDVCGIITGTKYIPF